MAGWNLGFWFSPKGVWCYSSQGETKRATLCPQWGARCVVLERREKGFHNSTVAHLLTSTTLFSYGTQALVSSEDFYFHSPKTWYPTCYFYQLFSPLLPTTYIIIFAPWKKPTHLHNSSCPSLSWATGHKAAGNKPDSSMTTAGSCQPKPSACSEFSDSKTLSLGEGNAGKVTCMS